MSWLRDRVIMTTTTGKTYQVKTGNPKDITYHIRLGEDTVHILNLKEEGQDSSLQWEQGHNQLVFQCLRIMTVNQRGKGPSVLSVVAEEEMENIVKFRQYLGGMLGVEQVAGKIKIPPNGFFGDADLECVWERWTESP